jgi:hypothetical protein
MLLTIDQGEFEQYYAFFWKSCPPISADRDEGTDRKNTNKSLSKFLILKASLLLSRSNYSFHNI